MRPQKRFKTASNIAERISTEIFENDDEVDIAFIPQGNESDIESNTDSENSDVEYDENIVDFDDEDDVDDDDIDLSAIDKVIPSYRTVLKNYSAKQKLLENDHEYDWVFGENPNDVLLQNECLLKDTQKNMICNCSPIELFEMFFSKSMKQYIIEASAENNMHITLEDLNSFIAIIILSTFNKRTSEKDYWSTDPLLECPIVRTVMSRDRFLEIKRNLKCSKIKDENSKDAAWRVREILEIFKKNVKCFGFFETALSVDEMMVKFYGRLKIKQYIRNKPTRFGIKMWALCGADGYLFDCDIYCGKNSNNFQELPECALGSRVVLQMLKSLLLVTATKKLMNYHLYFDNFFCNPDLVVHLRNIGLIATGIVRKDRIKEKNDLDQKSTRGSFIVKHDTNSGVNYITLKDSKVVSLLSTAAGVNPQKTVKRYSKEKKVKLT